MKNYRPEDSLIHSNEEYSSIINVALSLDLVILCEHDKFIVDSIGKDLEVIAKLLNDTYSEIDIPIEFNSINNLLDNLIMFLEENMSSCKECNSE